MTTYFARWHETENVSVSVNVEVWSLGEAYPKHVTDFFACTACGQQQG